MAGTRQNPWQSGIWISMGCVLLILSLVCSSAGISWQPVQGVPRLLFSVSACGVGTANGLMDECSLVSTTFGIFCCLVCNAIKMSHFLRFWFKNCALWLSEHYIHRKGLWRQNMLNTRFFWFLIQPVHTNDFPHICCIRVYLISKATGYPVQFWGQTSILPTWKFWYLILL